MNEDKFHVSVRAVLDIHIFAVDPAYSSFEVNVTMVKIVAFAICIMHFGRTRDGVEGGRLVPHLCHFVSMVRNSLCLKWYSPRGMVGSQHRFPMLINLNLLQMNSFQ